MWDIPIFHPLKPHSRSFHFATVTCHSPSAATIKETSKCFLHFMDFCISDSEWQTATAVNSTHPRPIFIFSLTDDSPFPLRVENYELLFSMWQKLAQPPLQREQNASKEQPICTRFMFLWNWKPTLLVHVVLHKYLFNTMQNRELVVSWYPRMLSTHDIQSGFPSQKAAANRVATTKWCDETRAVRWYLLTATCGKLCSCGFSDLKYFVCRFCRWRRSTARDGWIIEDGCAVWINCNFCNTFVICRKPSWNNFLGTWLMMGKYTTQLMIDLK